MAYASSYQCMLQQGQLDFGTGADSVPNPSFSFPMYYASSFKLRCQNLLQGMPYVPLLPSSVTVCTVCVNAFVAALPDPRFKVRRQGLLDR
jgi:hypothetical protein